MDNATKLLELAKRKFGTLTKAEEKLFQAVAKGAVADYSVKAEEDNDPAQADSWRPERVLSSDRIEWLCTNKQASELITDAGIEVNGARIDSNLNLKFAKISFPLRFTKSVFPSGINLRHAEIRGLFLSGTHTGPIGAHGLKVEGYVFLRKGFRAEGGVGLMGATIRGDLDFGGGILINRRGFALTADGLKVGGGIFLRQGFEAYGEVRLPGATIGGDLDCDNGKFMNKQAEAITADGAKVNGAVFLRDGFQADGEVRLNYTTIGGQLACSGGHFINPKGFAINADKTKVKGDVLFHRGFRAEGAVNLNGATIGGNLECNNGLFVNKEKIALWGNGLTVEGSTFLCDGFQAEGEVVLSGAVIGGDLDCDSGQFINRRAQALTAAGLHVKGCVLLRNGFKAVGEVSLLGTTIGGVLDCEKGHFLNEGACALGAETIKVEHGVYLRSGFEADGKVSFVDATIDGTFDWTDIVTPTKLSLDLRLAKISTLRDEKKSWPEGGNLLLYGLVYDQIDDDAPSGADRRLDWLRRQYELQAGKRKHQFWPQPYEQLAAVLRKSGRDVDAKKILIAKNEDKARLTKLTWSEWLWYRIFGRIIGYGYRPWRAAWIGLVIILLGWIFFWAGSRTDVMTLTKDTAYVSKGNGEDSRVSQDYPKFNALVYSLDVFVPLVDLHQASYWLPNANRVGQLTLSENMKLPISGNVLLYYFWFEIISGWVLTTLLVVGVTGLVRT